MALLVRDGRILLVHRRADRRWYPDCWDLVGGHIEPGETPEAAARRECQEEVGITVRALHPTEIVVSDTQLEAHAFLVTAWDGEPSNTAPDEHDDLGWFGADEIGALTIAHPASVPDIGRAVAEMAQRATKSGI